MKAPAPILTSGLLPRLLLATLLLGWGLAARAAETVIEFDVRTETFAVDPAHPIPPAERSSHQVQTVALGPDRVVVSNTTERRIINFAQRTVVTVSADGRSYTEYSLYGSLATRLAELRNREAMEGAMNAAHLDQVAALFDRFDRESELGVESKGASSVAIEETTKDKITQFQHGKSMARFQPSEQVLPASLQPRWNSYLIFFHHLHPKIRQRIAEFGVLPQEFSYDWKSPGRQTNVVVVLKSVRTADSDSSGIPSAAREEMNAADPFDAVMALVNQAAIDRHLPTRETAVDYIRHAAAEGRLLDSLLATMEYPLQSGDRPISEIQLEVDRINASPECQTYVRAFMHSSKAELEQGLVLNASLDRTHLEKAYMLDLQRGDILQDLRRSHEAIECFYRVLRGNPCHVGALHDLGIEFDRQFEQPRAWKCWDAARKLYPEHFMMREISDREKQLVVEYPAFF